MSAADIQHAAAVLVEAVDVDTDWWAWQCVAQDSQEAEDSGYLMGYRDALAACDLAMRLGKTDILSQYVESVSETTKERVEEMRADERS